MTEASRTVVQATVFVVDDDPTIRQALCLMFQVSGFQVQAYADGQSFLDDCGGDRPGCLLIDHEMPGMNGVQVVRALRQRRLLLPFIFLTGTATSKIQDEALALEAVAFLSKPVDGEQLLACVRRALAMDQGRRGGSAACAS